MITQLCISRLTAKASKRHFAYEKFSVLERPSEFPDLNIIENCWWNLAKTKIEDTGIENNSQILMN